MDVVAVTKIMLVVLSLDRFLRLGYIVALGSGAGAGYALFERLLTHPSPLSIIIIAALVWYAQRFVWVSLMMERNSSYEPGLSLTLLPEPATDADDETLISEFDARELACICGDIGAGHVREASARFERWLDDAVPEWRVIR